MGQGSSKTKAVASPEEFLVKLSTIFKKKCFTSTELRSFKQKFGELTQQNDDLNVWSAETLTKFLKIPLVLESTAVLYQLCGYLGAFPFASLVPAPLTDEALLRAICLMTQRYTVLLENSKKESWAKEIWRGCVPRVSSTAALNKMDALEQDQPTGDVSTTTRPIREEIEEDVESTDNNEDELAYQTLQLMDALEVFKQEPPLDLQHNTVPSEDFRELLKLLLVTSLSGHQELISSYSAELQRLELESLNTVTNCILQSFAVDLERGIGFTEFDLAVSNTLPHLFDIFGPLFERLLVSESPNPTTASNVEATSLEATKHLMPSQDGVLNIHRLSQLSFIFSGRKISRGLRPLYLGHKHGYSLGSFEKAVFAWQAPTFILISGTLLSPTTRQGSARVFLDDLPHRRLSSSAGSLISKLSAPALPEDSRSIIYGAYIPVPWEATDNTTFGSDQTTLFQLSPVHDVFPASDSIKNYAYFNKAPSNFSGLGFGSLLPSNNSMSTSQTSIRRPSVSNYSASDTSYGFSNFSTSFSGPPSPGMTRRSSFIGEDHIPLGPVSLHIDDGLEFAVFTHLAAGGSSFQHSKLPTGVRPCNDWQDRFEIDALEVWGIENT